MKVILLGSSFLLLHKGLSESLAGRFELIHIPHFSPHELKNAFNLNVEEIIFFGNYPGAAKLMRNERRWKRYILDSLIETTLSRDIFLVSKILKPSLMRRLFELGCTYSSQILSFQKMIGQLQDAGNTTTLAHYLNLLSTAGLLTGLSKYSGSLIRQRGSSPKLQVFNNALISAQNPYSFKEALADREYWGRLVESAVGAHLINSVQGQDARLFYWREGNLEVDFVLEHSGKLFAIEVKSGRSPSSLPGMRKFMQKFPKAQPVLIGGTGIKLEDFLLGNPLKQLC